MIISGAVLLGVFWLGFGVGGSVIVSDQPEESCTDCQEVGQVLWIPLLGPILANYAWIAAFLIVAGLAAMVLGPRVIAAHDRREVTWVDAWLKTAVIAVGAVVVTTLIPARVLEIPTVQDLPRAAQDLIAVSLWIGGVGATLLALWYAHRERRI